MNNHPIVVRASSLHLLAPASGPHLKFPTPARRLARAAAIVAAIAFTALLPPGVQAKEGDSDKFFFQSLEFTGARHDRTITDLDGDGLQDLAMVYSTARLPDQYFLRTCLQKPGTGFESVCKEVKFPDGARAFDVGEIDGAPGAELVVITSKGVAASTFAAGAFGPFKDLAVGRNILAGATGEEPSILRFLWDFNDDNKSEMIFPAIDGPAIYKHDGAGFSLIKQLPSPAHITYRVGSLGDIMATDDVNQFLRYRKYAKRTSATYVAPDVFVQDFDGDGKKDIITLVDNHLRVFLQTPDGNISDQPAVNLKKSILPQAERNMSFAGEAMTFNDLDGDKKCDIIMMKWGSSEERTQIDRFIYYAQPGLKYAPDDKPDQILRSESAAIDFGMYDLNKDAKLDLVIPFFHFAPAQAFKVMTENAIKIQFRIFLMSPSGRYTQEPGKTFAKIDQRVPIDYKIDILGMIFDIKTLLEGKFMPLISFGYDFNGDGYPDLVADTGGDKLTFYWGNPRVEFGRLPDLSIEYESAMDYDVVDLNNDGKNDIVTYYESKERTSKKRELAKKARDQGDQDFTEVERAAIATPEGIRIKVLISR